MLCCGFSCGQDYPSARLLRIVTSQPGSGSDAVARILVKRLPDKFGQNAIVDNRGILAPEIAAKAPPDGYTVLFYSTPLWVSPLLQSNSQWNAAKDFAPVTLAVNAPNLLVVHPSLPVKSVRDLLSLANARPGELNYGSGSAGSSSHLAAELFNVKAGVNIARVPYRGVGPALVGLLSGQVQVLFPSAGSVMPYVKSGRMRALAVSSAKPSALLPDLPTIAASGVPGYEADTPLGVFLPAGTPVKIVTQLQQGIAATLNLPDIKKLVLAQGAEPVASSPAEFAAWLKSDIARWNQLIHDKGLRDDP
jgi:tripartite-type tricarboxylate transporter receptor subunit TctC